MRREDSIRLQHMLDEAYTVMGFVKDYSFEDLKEDNKTVHAVVRAIEVIGEAAAKISAEYKNTHPDIPWEQIIGMRNHLIHVYFDVDYQTIWKTLEYDIPSLIEMIEKLKREK